VDELRREFPALDRLAYLNAGSNGPVPRRALDAARASIERQAHDGRSGRAFIESLVEGAGRLRARVAGLLGCEPGELALTGSTTDGVNAVLCSLGLGPGDEVLTSDEEHPGVLAPLAALRDRGVGVRVAPFGEIAGAVDERTSLVACSHVSWITGSVVDCGALAATGVPVLLDGAQGLGALPVDVRALGCDFYAASGQKWLCGPNGAGYLYVRAGRCAELPPPWPGYGTLVDASAPLDSPFHVDARRFDVSGFPAAHQLAWALAALDVLEDAGLARVQARAVAGAGALAGRLEAAGLELAPRGESTLVSWRADDPPGQVAALAERGLVVRDLPTTSYVRASVGAWNGDEDIDRLVEAVAPRPA
jgi:L-cysteine/cystine lyase